MRTRSAQRRNAFKAQDLEDQSKIQKKSCESSKAKTNRIDTWSVASRSSDAKRIAKRPRTELPNRRRGSDQPRVIPQLGVEDG